MKNILSKLIMVLCGTALVMSGCSKEPSEKQYVYLSDASITFQYEGNEPYSITVEASPVDWTATSTASWLKAEESGDKLMLTVEDNIDGLERTATVEVNAGSAQQTITVIQLGDDGLPMRFRKLADLHSSVVSPNAKWAGGYYSVSDTNTGGSVDNIVFINLDTDERTVLGPYPESLMVLTSVQCMTDSGLLYAVDGGLGGMKVFDVNEKDYYSAEASGFDGASLGISNVSADGSMWVGWVSENGHCRPLVNQNGNTEMLPLPKAGFRDQPYGEDGDFDLMARGMSTDGSIIYGTTWDNKDCGMIYWDAERKVHFVGEDQRKVTTIQRPDGYGGTYDYNIVNGMISWSGQYQISPNGEWIAGTWRTETSVNEGNQIEEALYPAFYNVVDNKTYIFEEYGDGSGMVVTDDGIGFIGTPSMYTSNTQVVKIETGESLGTLKDYVFDKYGVYLPTGFLVYLTPDQNFFWGATLESTELMVVAPNWYLGPTL